MASLSRNLRKPGATLHLSAIRIAEFLAKRLVVLISARDTDQRKISGNSLAQRRL